MMDKFVTWMMQKLESLEHRVQAMPNVILPNQDSMPFFDFIKRGGGMKAPSGIKDKFKFYFKLYPYIARALAGNFKSQLSLKKDPDTPKTVAGADFIDAITQFAMDKGACRVGFTKLEPQYIFDHTAILYENAIVLAQEMDEEKIASSPSLDCKIMVQQVYADLGDIANDLASYLRKHGYGAQSSVALRGTTVFPIMAQKANIGMVGRNGLLLTEELGARVRLAVVYTSISNLPFADSANNPYKWIRDYCDACGICVRKCPPKALYNQPIKRPGGETYVDNTKCFPYFHKYHGCAICIKVCPFSKKGFKVNKKALYELLENRKNN